MTPTNSADLGRYARAVDHFADAKRFAQQAEIAAQRGNTDEADAFAKMACEAASSGALEMGHLF